MKKILLIVLGWLLLFGKVSANETESSFFNPENTWEYYNVNYNYPTATDELYVYTSKLQLFYDGEEECEGKQYMRFNWKYENGCPDDSYFLLREENGAYYCYIEQSPDESWRRDVYSPPGEYLLYDFNMEEGEYFHVPYPLLGLFTGDSTALQPNRCQIAVFHVLKKEIDHQGRRVLKLSGNNNPGIRFPGSITIVEGIGPITGESILTTYLFSYYTTGSNPPPYRRFYRVLDKNNEEIYLSNQELDAGFVKEKEYEWVYGIFSPDGEVSYMKARFNDLFEHNDHLYRRFICTFQDQPWDKIREGNVFYIREEDNKVFLLHQEGFLGIEYYSYETPISESLIYDFRETDRSELSFYSPEGELTRLISSGVTEVDGINKRSYTFDDSDDVKCVEGIGITKGGILPVVNPEFRLPKAGEEDSYVSAVLVAVYDGDDNLIFRQDMPEAVEEIAVSGDGLTAPAERIFDLQGRGLREPIHGQPYIREGKIHIDQK